MCEGRNGTILGAIRLYSGVDFRLWRLSTTYKTWPLMTPLLVIAARLVQSGRQKELQVSISGGWASQLRDGYIRLHEWIRSTAPQFNNIMPVSTPGGADFAMPTA